MKLIRYSKNEFTRILDSQPVPDHERPRMPNTQRYGTWLNNYDKTLFNQMYEDWFATQQEKLDIVVADLPSYPRKMWIQALKNQRKFSDEQQ